jgi:protein SCO1/2
MVVAASFPSWPAWSKKAAINRRTPKAFALLLLLLAAPAHGQLADPGFPEEAKVKEVPDAQVPLEVEFQDEDGQTVRLGDYFQPGRPVIMTMVYYRCPVLCKITLREMVRVIRPLELKPGRDYEVVVVGFDPREGPGLAKAQKQVNMDLLGRPQAESAWHFLSSSKPAAARQVGEAIGFGYKLDDEGKDYLHEVGVYICTPDGRVARTIRSLADVNTKMLNDSLINASQGKISSGLFGVALSCGMLDFDATKGQYTWRVMAIVRAVGIGTVLILGAGIGLLVYRDRHRQHVVTEGGSA